MIQWLENENIILTILNFKGTNWGNKGIPLKYLNIEWNKKRKLNDEKSKTNAHPLWIDYSINIKLMEHGDCCLQRQIE